MNVRTSTRDRIVEAATALFWREGYHPVSTDALCRAVGIRKSSLYHAFPSKAHILAAALEAVWERNWHEIQQCYQGDDRIDVKFSRHLLWFATSQRRLCEEHGVVLGTFDMAVGVSIPEDVAALMRSHQLRHDELLTQSVAAMIDLRGGDPAITPRVSELVGYVILASTIRARLDNDIGSLERLPERVSELLGAMAKTTI